MAARSSYHEDRNQQRIRERERRNQEAHQEKELYLKITPLFGEPYKTSKGDELSDRIQRMLGNYEEVKELIGNNPHQTLFSRLKNLPPPGSYSRPSRPPHVDNMQTPFQDTQQLDPPQPTRPSIGLNQAPKKPSGLGHGQPSAGYCPSLSNRRQENPNPHKEKSPEDESSTPPILPSLSPPTEPLSPLHSSNNSDSESQELEDKDSPCSDEMSSPEAQDIVSQANEGVPLPSQNFPPPLPSKPNLVMPQKPTAYVRPMDGQDQVPSKSPYLKPSPEDFHGQSHENQPDLKSSSKPSLSKLKMPPEPIEALANEAHCVEEILREMTHSWPPPLTAIHTPGTTEPSKFSFPTKETQHAHSGFSGHSRCYGSSPKAPSSNCQHGAAVSPPYLPPRTVQSTSAVPAHSSAGESASSSGSESTSESDSESNESANEEVPLHHRSNPSAPKADDVPTENKWHLHNWIKINQQNSSADSQGDRTQPLSPLPKQRHEEKGEVSPARNCKSQMPTLAAKFSDNEVKPAPDVSHSPVGCLKTPVRTDSRGQRKTVGSKHPSKAAMASRTEVTKPGLKVESVEVVSHDTNHTFTEKPKVKTKPSREKGSLKADSRKLSKRGSSEGKKPKLLLPKDESASIGRSEMEAKVLPSPAHIQQPSAPASTRAVKSEKSSKKSKKKSREVSCTDNGKHRVPRKGKRSHSLVVKIKLDLLSRVPQPRDKAAPAASKGEEPREGKRPAVEKEDGGKSPSQGSRKREAEKEGQTLPRKCPKLEKEAKPSSSNQSSRKKKVPSGTEKERDKRKASKSKPASRDVPKASGHKRRPTESQEASKLQDGGQKAKHKKSAIKCSDHPRTGKKAPKGGDAFPVPAQPAGAPAPSRPLLKFEDRKYPVEYHMKEAKKLKHKADAASDKVSKAFDYLDAAMSFVESGIAMESDPQTSKSAYSMFSDTMTLIRFILKLKSSVDPSAPASEKDFVVLCMRCQSLLQMAMFRYKRETALRYSRTLSEHFKNSSRTVRAPSPCVSKSTGTPSPMSPMPSPASSASSGPASSHSSCGATVVIPQVVLQMASSYVNITALFLSAHETWEQAELLAQGGSGLLLELDFALGPLSLTSNMKLLVRHTRQGLHWLRLDSNVV